jgi:hypothetical protein
MRGSLCFGLLAFGLVAAGIIHVSKAAPRAPQAATAAPKGKLRGLRAEPRAPQGAPEAPKGKPRGLRAEPRVPPAAAPAPEPTKVLEGYYPLTGEETREDAGKKAQEDALNKAHDYVVRDLGLNWNPTVEQLTRAGMVKLEGAPEEKKLGAGEVVMRAVARVEITSQSHQQLESLARQQRSQHRHVLLARGLAGLVVLFVVVAGYLRLEDLTRGYYTQLLRLAAIGVLAGAAAALALVA